MDFALMNQRVYQTEGFKHPIRNASDAKAFFRLLWFDLGLDFNPDDDFAGYGVFDDAAVELLNQRMDEAFDVLGMSIYDIAINIMSSDK